MDFEDGKRCPWLVAAVGGSRGGLRWGSVYRLKMAVWALFCGPSSRLPARPPAAGPVPGVGLFGNPRAAIPPARRPLSPGTWEFRAGLGGGGKDAPRARRPPDSGSELAPAPVQENYPDASNFPVSGKGASGASSTSARVRPTGQRPRSSV